MIELLLPVKTVNELNGSHCHWRTVASRRKHIRRQSVWAMATAKKPALPCVIRLTRLSAGVLDDDGLRAALKSVRDGIADSLDIADNDNRVRWDYAQAKCKRGEYGVRIQITSGEFE